MPPYLSLGVAAIALWPLAPAVSALQIGPGGKDTWAYVVVMALYAGAVAYMGLHQASGLSRFKMAVVGVVSIINVGCFLYLWL